jgi:quercetin dioxygenase-like cupin family protein
MAKSGQVIENPRRKARMTFLRTAGDTEGELLAMLAEEEPTLARPPLHRHPHQEERFEVRSGTLDYQLGEQVYTAGPGEVAVVPPRVPHTWWNSGSEKLVAQIELRPALRFETCLETIYGLTMAGRVSPRGALAASRRRCCSTHSARNTFRWPSPSRCSSPARRGRS